MSENPVPAPYSDTHSSADYSITPEGTVRGPRRARRGGVLGGAVAAVALVLGKLKFVLLIASKGGTTLGSLLLSVGAWALIYPWQFAVGLLGMIFVHEMGHFVVARQQGIRVTAPIFVPFVGAFVGLKQHPHNARQEAVIAMAGPIVGTAAAFLTLAAGQASEGTNFGGLLVAIAHVGFVINLFNLIPVSPLDGGRVLSLLSKWFSLVGLAVLVGLLFLVAFNPLLLLIIGVGGWATWQRFRGRAESPEYYAVPVREKAVIGLLYLALVIALALVTMTTEMHPVRPLVTS